MQRWWTQYVTGGLEAVEARKRPGGSTGRITPEAWGSLQEAMAMGQVARLKAVQRHLRQPCGIVYRGVRGLSRILKRHGVKLKTGRRQYRKADREQQEAFKKGLRSPPAPARH